MVKTKYIDVHKFLKTNGTPCKVNKHLRTKYLICFFISCKNYVKI
jgi:hypothetical protein